MTFLLFACAAAAITLWTTLQRIFCRVTQDYPPSQIERLHERAVWLEMRLDTARQERWCQTTINSLSEQLGATCEELARAQSSSSRAPAVSAS